LIVYSSPWHQYNILSCIAEVTILPVEQLTRVLLMVLVSDWTSVPRNERRSAMTS
jgi:uncharacterized protein (UPF0147 family)